MLPIRPENSRDFLAERLRSGDRRIHYDERKPRHGCTLVSKGQAASSTHPVARSRWLKKSIGRCRTGKWPPHRDGLGSCSGGKPALDGVRDNVRLAAPCGAKDRDGGLPHVTAAMGRRVAFLKLGVQFSKVQPPPSSGWGRRVVSKGGYRRVVTRRPARWQDDAYGRSNAAGW